MFAKKWQEYKDSCQKMARTISTFGQLLVTIVSVLANKHSETQSLQHEDNPKHFFKTQPVIVCR